MYANCVSLPMGGKNMGVMLSLLIVGLSPLGHCAALKGGKNMDSLKVLNTQKTPQSGTQAEDEKPQSKVRPGKLIIGLNKSAHEDYHNILEDMKTGNGSPHESGYQSDQADWSDLQHFQGSVYGFGASNSPAVQQLLGMRPKVECTEDSVRLNVHGGMGVFGYGLLIDRGNVAPLPLSRVPLECGFQIQRRWRDLEFIVPYDGCYVSQERDAYIIPIRLCGLAAKLSCPLLNLAPSPPSVSCYPNGMIVKTRNVVPVEDLWVKVENRWQSLLEASPKCGYNIVSHSEGVVISAPYKPCMEAKDEMYSLHMVAKTEFTLFCPSFVPGLPLNLSSPLPPYISDSIDGSPVMEMPTPASPVPTTRPTSWRGFGRPHQRYRLNSFKPSHTTKLSAIPDKPTWTGSWPTSLPSATTLPTPQNVPGMRHLQFPETWYPNYPRSNPVPPAVPKDTKPGHAILPSTSGTALPDPSSEQHSDLGDPLTEIPRQNTLPKYMPPGTFPFQYSENSGPVNHPESIFVPAAQPYTPQDPQGPILSPTVEPFEATDLLGLTGYHWTPSQMSPESGFPHGYQWPHQNSPRPALSLTAAPPFEASSALGTAGSHYQEVSQTSNPLGYPQCCQSPIMYSNCCPPPIIYHQHNHHHFDFSNPIVNRGAASRSTRNLTSFYRIAYSGSAQKLVTSQNQGKYAQRPVAINSERASPSSQHFRRLLKPPTGTQVIPDPSVPSTKPFWADEMLPLSGSPQKIPNSLPFAQFRDNNKPRPGSDLYFGEFSSEHSRTNPQEVSQENAGPSNNPSLLTSEQTHLNHYMFQPHESSQSNYGRPANNLHSSEYNNPPTYFLHDPSKTRLEQQMQALNLHEKGQSISKQTQLPVQPSTHSQEQYPGVLDGLPNAPSSERVAEDSSMPLLQMLTGPFKKGWVPVVPPNQVEQKFVRHQSHGLV